MGLDAELVRVATNLESLHAHVSGLPERVTRLETQREQCEAMADAHGRLADAFGALDRRVADLERRNDAAEKVRTEEKKETRDAIEKAGERRWSWVQMLVNALLAAASAVALWKAGVKP